MTIADGTADVALAEATPEQTAEIVYTLTQFPSIKRVDVAGRTGLTRADVAPFVPPILVETPAAHATVPTTHLGRRNRERVRGDARRRAAPERHACSSSTR